MTSSNGQSFRLEILNPKKFGNEPTEMKAYTKNWGWISLTPMETVCLPRRRFRSRVKTISTAKIGKIRMERPLLRFKASIKTTVFQEDRRGRWFEEKIEKMTRMRISLEQMSAWKHSNKFLIGFNDGWSMILHWSICSYLPITERLSHSLFHCFYFDFCSSTS